MADKTHMDTEQYDDSDITDASFVSDTTRDSENQPSPTLLGLNMLRKSGKDEVLHGHNTGTDVGNSPIIPLQSSSRRRHNYDEEDPIQETIHDPDKDMSDAESNASELILSDTRFRNITKQFPTRYNQAMEITKEQRLSKETSKKSCQPPDIIDTDDNNVDQFGVQKHEAHVGLSDDIQTQTTTCLQQLSVSKSNVSSEKVDDPIRNISGSQSLFGDTQSSQDDTQIPETGSLQTHKHLNIVGDNMSNDNTEESNVFASQKQNGLLNCLTLSQIIGDEKNDNQSKKDANSISLTQTSSTSSLSSLDNINPTEDWKKLSKPEQHFREKKVIEKMEKIQEKMKSKLESSDAVLYMRDEEKMKQKYKLLQNVLKKITEYHKEERKRLSYMIQKSNKTKAEKMVLKSFVHQLSGRQKDVFRIYQNHQKLGILMKETIACKKSGAEEQDQYEYGEGAVQAIGQSSTTDPKNRTTKKIGVKKTSIISKQDTVEKSDMSRKDVDCREKAVARSEQVISSTKNLSGKFIGPKDQITLQGHKQGSPSKPIRMIPKITHQSLLQLNNIGNTGSAANIARIKATAGLGSQSINKQIIYVSVPTKNNNASGASKVPTAADKPIQPTFTVDQEDVAQQPIARTDFKSPINVQREKTTENISPSTASCSDVFPVKSEEIHRRVQMRLSQLRHDEAESQKIKCVQTNVNGINKQQPEGKKDVLYTTPNDTMKTTNIQQAYWNNTSPLETQRQPHEIESKYPSLVHLINKGILKPGRNVLSMTCKGKTYTGSLNQKGKIESVGGEKFLSPVQWLKSVADGEKIVKSRAFREVHYLDEPLLSYVDRTVKLAQKDIEKIDSCELSDTASLS